MPTSAICPACESLLRIPETASGKRVKCPKCGHAFLAAVVEEPLPELGLADRVIERPTATVSRRQPVADEPEDLPPRLKRKPRRTDSDEGIQSAPTRRERPKDDPEEVEDVVAAEEPGPRRRKKKKRKPKGRPLTFEGGDSASWPWWVFGGGGMFAVMFLLLCVTLFASPENPAKVFAAFLLIAMPISTVIFFFAMFLSSVILGAIEIGEIHVAIVKSFFLLLVVNMVSLLPGGGYLALFVWFIGALVVFRLDLWEARMLIFINWILNFGVRFLLLTALMSWAAHASLHDEGRLPVSVRSAGPNGGWDAAEVEARGGTVELDPANQDDDIVIAISFRGGRVTDADLAHLKDFPRMARLDLSNTGITDQGLAHLKACKNLQQLLLSGTRVTEQGVQDLQRAIPQLQVIR
jgi:predicted Zn finger-like uncharacterized protein